MALVSTGSCCSSRRRERVTPTCPYSARTKPVVTRCSPSRVASNLALLVETARGYTPPSRQNFDIVAYIGRFAQIREDVPKTATIGYLTDAEPNITSTYAEFGLAQLALIPIVIANNTDQKLVMANVHTPQPPAFYQSHGLELVRDYGNGVMLLRKAAR